MFLMRAGKKARAKARGGLSSREEPGNEGKKEGGGRGAENEEGGRTEGGEGERKGRRSKGPQRRG